MPKRRRIQGTPLEIMYFFVENFQQSVEGDESLIPNLKEQFSVLGINLLEFDTVRGSLAVINESPFEVPLDSMYKVLDGLGLKASYSKSEYV